MKKLNRILILLTATCLSTAGLTAQADMLSKKAVPDMNIQSQGPIATTSWCAGGNGPN